MAEKEKVSHGQRIDSGTYYRTAVPYACAGQAHAHKYKDVLPPAPQSGVFSWTIALSHTLSPSVLFVLFGRAELYSQKEKNLIKPEGAAETPEAFLCLNQIGSPPTTSNQKSLTRGPETNDWADGRLLIFFCPSQTTALQGCSPAPTITITLSRRSFYTHPLLVRLSLLVIHLLPW